MRQSVLFSLVVIAALTASLPVAARAAQQTVAPGTPSSASTAEIIPTLPVLLPAAGGAGGKSAAGIQMAATATAGGSATPAASTDGTARAGTSGPALRASRILRDTVTDSAGNEIGQVDNLLVDSGSGCVLYAVVTGGAAGAELGERAFFVPWSLLTFTTKQNAFVLNAGADALANAPGLDRYTTWPSLGAPGWDGQIRDYWQRYGPNGRLNVACGATATAGAAGSTATAGGTATPATVVPAVTGAGTVAGGTAGALGTATPPATAGAGIGGGSPLGTPAAARVNVTLQEFTIIIPTTIPAGPTTFVVTNAGTLSHNFEIAGQGLDQKFSRSLEPGESATMAANLRPGSYQVFCPVDGHRAQGMQVQLTVTAAGGTGGGSPAPGSATATVTPGGSGSATPEGTGLELAAPSPTAGIGAPPVATATGGALGGIAGAATPAGLPGPGTSTPGAPGSIATPAGAAGFAGLVRITQLASYRLLAAGGQPLGNVVDMIIDPASGQVLYVAATTAGSNAQAVPAAGLSGTATTPGTVSPPSTPAPSGASPGGSATTVPGNLSPLSTPLPGSTSQATPAAGAGNSSTVVLIPWSALMVDQATRTLTLQTTAAEAARALSFSRLQWPDLTAPGWDGALRGFWQGLGITVGAMPAQGTPGSGAGTATPGSTVTPAAGLFGSTNTPAAAATSASSQMGTPTAGSAGTPGATGRLMGTQNIVGAALQDAAGKELGRISDLIANPANDSMTYVVLSRGGVLGLGAQAIAVPWPALAFDPGRQVFRLNIEQAVLDRAPAFDPPAVDGGSPDWDAGVRSYWRSQGLPLNTSPAHGTGSATPAAQAGAGSQTGTGTSGPATVSPNATAGPAAGGTSVPSTLPFAGAGSSAVRLNRLLGYRVKAVNGADVGDVVGLALAMGNGQGTTATPGAHANVAGAGSEANAGQIVYVLVGRGGVLGLGRQIVPVPWPLFALSQVNRTLTINTDEQTFRQAPTADVNSAATAQGSDWDAAVQAYWAGR